MARTIIPCAALALAVSGPGAVHAQAAFTYTNDRFGFSVDIPAGFVATRPPDNNDGRDFRSSDGAQITAWAGYNALFNTMSQEIEQYVPECAGHKATYLTVHADWAVLSCPTNAGRIIYQKTMLRGAKDDGVFTSVRMTYPASQHTKWDGLAVAAAKSLQPAVPQ